jgi:hypothetical protein
MKYSMYIFVTHLTEILSDMRLQKNWIVLMSQEKRWGGYIVDALGFFYKISSFYALLQALIKSYEINYTFSSILILVASIYRKKRPRDDNRHCLFSFWNFFVSLKIGINVPDYLSKTMFYKSWYFWGRIERSSSQFKI